MEINTLKSVKKKIFHGSLPPYAKDSMSRRAIYMIEHEETVERNKLAYYTSCILVAIGISLVALNPSTFRGNLVNIKIN